MDHNLATRTMAIAVDTFVTHPGYKPYPRFGRVTELLADNKVRVTSVQCGDPRCASEHHHGDVVWEAAALEGATAYQIRAGWESGRVSSPNTPIE